MGKCWGEIHRGLALLNLELILEDYPNYMVIQERLSTGQNKISQLIPMKSSNFRVEFNSSLPYDFTFTIIEIHYFTIYIAIWYEQQHRSKNTLGRLDAYRQFNLLQHKYEIPEQNDTAHGDGEEENSESSNSPKP